MYSNLFLYGISLLVFLKHKDFDMLHMQNRLVVSTYTLFLPLYMLFKFFIYNEPLLSDNYYKLLTIQLGYYIFDIIPVIIKKDYEQVIHHIVGPFLNYIGYITRFNKTLMFMTICIYFLEQGIHFFHSLMKILDGNNLKKTMTRYIIKKIYFSTIKLFFLFKIILTFFVFFKSPMKYSIFFFIQLFWNYYILRKKKIL